MTDLLSSLRERGIDLKSTLFIFLGGGSILLKELIKNSGLISHVQFIDDIHANAERIRLLVSAGRVIVYDGKKEPVFLYHWI